jgi:hypothetical protein
MRTALAKDATMPGELNERVFSFRRMDGQYKLARLVSWAFCLALAAIEAWTGQQYFDPDSIAYLDMSDGVLRNDWHTLINPYWSSRYPFMVGVVPRICHPSPRWELPLTHLLNFVIFIGALTAFEFMMSQVIAALALPKSRPQSELPMLERTYVWGLLGYSVFAWTAFCLAGSVRKSLPDLCVVTFIYLDAGLVLRILSRQRSMILFICLGAALGSGYYAKAILFPVGVLFMVVAVCAAGGLRKAWLPALAMILIFASITAPLVALTSRAVGHLSTGETGRMNYAWWVYGQPSAFNLSPPLADFRVDPPNLIHPEIAFYGAGMPVARILHHSPDVLQLARQGNATYPPWSDPASFTSGLEAPFHMRDQIRSIGINLGRCLAILVLPIPLTLAAYLVLFFGAARSPGRWQSILRIWPLFIIGISGLSLYILVEFVPRLIAAFAALVWIALLCGVQFQRSKGAARLTSIALVTFISSLTAMAIGVVTFHIVRPPRSLQGAICEASVVASELSKEGVKPGDVIAVIGDGEDSMAVARFARVRIDVVIPPKEDTRFWHISDLREKNDVYEAFREAGARFVVSDEVPPGKGFEEWRRVADTEFYIRNLESSARE